MYMLGIWASGLHPGLQPRVPTCTRLSFPVKFPMRNWNESLGNISLLLFFLSQRLVFFGLLPLRWVTQVLARAKGVVCRKHQYSSEHVCTIDPLRKAQCRGAQTSLPPGLKYCGRPGTNYPSLRYFQKVRAAHHRRFATSQNTTRGSNPGKWQHTTADRNTPWPKHDSCRGPGQSPLISGESASMIRLTPTH